MNNNNQYHKYTIMYLVGGIGFSLALLFYDYDINNFLSIPSFMMVIAPIIVEEGVTIAAGSTITDNSEKDSLLIARSRQQEKKNWKKIR